MLAERSEVQVAIGNFGRTAFDLFGDGTYTSCRAADVQLRADWLEACLKEQLTSMTTAVPTNESDFRKRVIEADRLFQETRRFAKTLNNSGLAEKINRALIHRKTGLLIEHVAAPEVTSQDLQLVSGMLSAIQEFVRDSRSSGRRIGARRTSSFRSRRPRLGRNG